MTVIAWVLLLITALISSAVSGVLGMAGGILLLGVMTAVLEDAAAVVPLHGVIQLASNFTRTLVFLRDVQWRLFSLYALPLAAGTFVATLVWSNERMDWFEPCVGVFILVFLVWRRRESKLRALPLWTYIPLGFVVGFLTIFLGATGPLIAPFFLRDDFRKEQVIATKAVCQSWGHLLKIPAFLSMNFDYTVHWKLLAAMLVCVIIGTLVGRRILQRIPERVFTLLFELVLGTIALSLVIKGFSLLP